MNRESDATFSKFLYNVHAIVKQTTGIIHLMFHLSSVNQMKKLNISITIQCHSVNLRREYKMNTYVRAI